MGLAPYGNPNTYREFFKAFYKLLPDGNYVLYLERVEWIRQICPGRHDSSSFTRAELDVAAALQEMLEIIVFHIITWFREKYKPLNLCMAGGVALNCALNGKLLSSGVFEGIFVYPAAGDCGLIVGSALAAYLNHNDNPDRHPLVSLYLGTPIGTEDSISGQLAQWEGLIACEKLADPAQRAAELIGDGKVIGWVQGRSEFAPRALGNRSILADPRPADNKDRINAMIKKREGFRPFAPSVLAEFAKEYFEIPGQTEDLPYMMFTVKVVEKYRACLGAVTHVDGTARVQTVSKEENPEYWKLIKHFQTISGLPIVLNTSFNNNAEPIVDSVFDAVVCFLTTNLDHLIVGNYLVSKKNVGLEVVAGLFPALPAHVRLSGKAGGYFVSNSYNDRQTSVSDVIYRILQGASGNAMIRDLLDAPDICQEQKQEVLKGLVNLWEKRLIILRPAISMSQVS
jgi:carbamoyltransferase